MKQWLEKFWSGTTVYDEAVCFLGESIEDSFFGTLLYTPTKVVSVTSSDGSVQYEEGIDYTIVGNQIHRTKESKIPVLLKKDYYRPYLQEEHTNWLRTVDGDYYLSIYPGLSSQQFHITYEHQDLWSGCIPQNQSERLPLSTNKLLTREKLKIVYYGDSITAGWESSGCDEMVIDMYSLKEFHLHINRPPYLPSWSSLVTNRLKDFYNHPQIEKVNRGAGGSSSQWGVDHVDEFVNPHNPDLVVLAYGMNNLNDEPSKYTNEIQQIITAVREKHPLCEFILVSAMEPNREIGWLSNHRLLDHEEALFDLQSTIKGIAVAPVHRMFLDLLKSGKAYMDISGNCINHPNDYAVRIYAQTILSVFGI